MKRRFFLLMLLLFISPVFLLAQNTGSVKGKVIDANSNANLPGVNIVVNGTIYGTATNAGGYYELLKIPAGTYKITASMIGYKTSILKVRISGKETKELNFRLEEFVQNIEEIKITAKSRARELREQAVPVSFISIKDIQGTVSNINDILAKTAGIKIRNYGGVGSASRISVRGLEGKRVGIFIEENGKLYVLVNIPAYYSNPPNFITDRTVIAVEIDLAAKTVKKIDIPRGNCYGSVGKYNNK